MLISVVIPCYRSEGVIASVVEELTAVFAAHRHTEYEVILVSDSSPDGVFDVIQEMAADDPHVKGIELARNFGQHASLMAGYRHSRGDIIVSLDDDGQTPPAAIFSLVDKLSEGYDVVYAAYATIKQSFYRRVGTGLNKVMMETLLHKPKEVVVTSYFACRQFVIKEMLRYDSAFPYLGGLVFRTTRHIANVCVEQRERTNGRSGYSIGKLMALWLNGFTAFSIKPLRMATITGVVCAAGGFLYGLWIILKKLLLFPEIPIGYSSSMAMLLFIGGMIMLMLGIVGEYVGRIYISLNHAPQYVVRQTVNLGSEGETKAKRQVEDF